MKYILAKFVNYSLPFQKGKLQVNLTRESPKQCKTFYVTVNSLENNSGQVILTNIQKILRYKKMLPQKHFECSLDLDFLPVTQNF